MVCAGVARACGARSPLRLLRGATRGGETGEGAGELRWHTAPYAAPPRAQRPPPAPADCTVLLFPGQGSHRVGMGRRLLRVPAARDLYQLASEELGWDVARVCTEGPAEELERRCQPALLVTSLAALELARDERPAAVERARVAVGFSLGEWAAAVWAGVLSLGDALRVLEVRAASMSAAAEARPGGMLTVWVGAGVELPELLRRARDAAAAAGVPGPVCSVANQLYPGCRVLAGDEAALRFVEERGAALGVRRTARVRVAGAWHCALMAPAAEATAAALAAVRVRTPRAQVVSCVDARPLRSATRAARLLARHCAAPLRWEAALHAVFARPAPHPQPLTLALGPAAAARATLKMVNARAWDNSLLVEA